MLSVWALLPSPRGSAAPLCARLRLYPAPLMHREDNGAAHSWDITRKVSLKKKIGLSLFRATARDDKDEWLTVGGYRLPDFLDGIIWLGKGRLGPRVSLVRVGRGQHSVVCLVRSNDYLFVGVRGVVHSVRPVVVSEWSLSNRSIVLLLRLRGKG